MAPAPTATAMPAPTAMPAAPADEGVKRGGTFLVPQRSGPRAFLPSEAGFYSGNQMFSHVYDKLVRWNWGEPKDEILPHLAESWEISSVADRYTFKLKSGVRWHDGEAFTASDAKYSLENQSGRVAPEYAIIGSVDTPDDTTLVVNLAEPNSNFLAPLAMQLSPIYAEHVLEAYSGEPINAPQIGTGPYLYEEFTPDVSMDLSANPDYHVPGIPYLDAVKFLYIPEEGTRVAAFKAGRLHVLGPGATTVSAPVIADLKSTVPDLNENEFFSLEVAGIFFNTARAPWDDIRVRRAAFLVFDHQTALNVLPEHVLTAGFQVGPPGWGISESELLTRPGFRSGADLEADRAEAKRLLAEAGFADGLDVENVVVSGTTYNGTFWQFAQDQLKTVGINASGVQLPFAEHAAAKTNGDFTLNVDSPAMNYADPNGAILSIIPGIFVKLEDAQTADLFAQQRGETDPAKRRQLVIEMQERMFETIPYVPVSWLGSFWPGRPEVQNYTSPLGQWGNVIWDRVWLDQ
jgi:peptide/nickel transport system substrate-binding protein